MMKKFSWLILLFFFNIFNFYLVYLMAIKGIFILPNFINTSFIIPSLIVPTIYSFYVTKAKFKSKNVFSDDSKSFFYKKLALCFTINFWLFFLPITYLKYREVVRYDQTHPGYEWWEDGLTGVNLFIMLTIPTWF